MVNTPWCQYSLPLWLAKDIQVCTTATRHPLFRLHPLPRIYQCLHNLQILSMKDLFLPFLLPPPPLLYPLLLAMPSSTPDEDPTFDGDGQSFLDVDESVLMANDDEYQRVLRDTDRVASSMDVGILQKVSNFLSAQLAVKGCSNSAYRRPFGAPMPLWDRCVVRGRILSRNLWSCSATL